MMVHAIIPDRFACKRWLPLAAAPRVDGPRKSPRDRWPRGRTDGPVYCRGCAGSLAGLGMVESFDISRCAN
jgi:hypothetical protein